MADGLWDGTQLYMFSIRFSRGLLIFGMLFSCIPPFSIDSFLIRTLYFFFGSLNLTYMQIIYFMRFWCDWWVLNSLRHSGSWFPIYGRRIGWIVLQHFHADKMKYYMLSAFLCQTNKCLNLSWSWGVSVCVCVSVCEWTSRKDYVQHEQIQL